MRKYILKLIDADIDKLEKSLQWQIDFLQNAAFKSQVEKSIEKKKAKILEAKKYKEMFLKRT